MFKAPFSFEGRVRRLEYGISLIIYAIPTVFINALVEIPGNDFFVFAYIPLLWFLWAQGAKREHDLGNSGWWQIIPFRVFWLLFQDGQLGSNQYGENPKGIQSQNNVKNNYSRPNLTNTINQPTTSSQFGYNGGHNSQDQSNLNVNQPNQKPNDGSYKKGDLYN